MKRVICGVALLWALGCASDDGFGDGVCVGASGSGGCENGGVALCRVPECDGAGWIDYSTTGVLCRRVEGRDGRPYCERESDEMCWTEEEVRALCAGDGG